jgi:hypothetical protein
LGEGGRGKSPFLYFSGQWNFEGTSCSKKKFLKSTPAYSAFFSDLKPCTEPCFTARFIVVNMPSS